MVGVEVDDVVGVAGRTDLADGHLGDRLVDQTGEPVGEVAAGAGDSGLVHDAVVAVHVDR